MQSVRIGLLVTFVIGVVSLGQPRTAHAEIIRVAMLPVSINSSLPETDHLSAGLADMVAARLEQNGQIMVIRLDAPATSREEAIAAGREAGAEYVLFGSYTQFGAGARLDLHCREVFDVQGAGDTTVAALAIALRAGATLLEAAVLANAAAGVVVGKIGTATATPEEVRRLLPAAIAAAREAA